MRDHTKIADIKKGLKVEIESREGFKIGAVEEILTNRDNPKGIKVRVSGGFTGRITRILEDDDKEKPAEKKKEFKTDKTDNINNNSVTNNVVSDIKQIKAETVIHISDNDILDQKEIAKTSQFNAKKYEVTTRFFKSVYCKKIHDELKGIVMFKVHGENINICVYKINKYLKKFCVTKDIKYEIVKVEER